MKPNGSWEDLLESASGDVRRMSYADRFTTIPVTFRENVAEHSYWVALYAVMIHRFLSHDETLIGAITLHALTHDLAECISGDVVRTFKYSTKELKTAIDNAEELVVKQLPREDIQELYPLWEAMAGSNKQYVKAVIKAADFLSLFEYMNREVLRGNKEIDQFITRLKNDLMMMADNAAAASDVELQEFSGIYGAMASRIGRVGVYTT